MPVQNQNISCHVLRIVWVSCIAGVLHIKTSPNIAPTSSRQDTLSEGQHTEHEPKHILWIASAWSIYTSIYHPIRTTLLRESSVLYTCTQRYTSSKSRKVNRTRKSCAHPVDLWISIFPLPPHTTHTQGIGVKLSCCRRRWQCAKRDGFGAVAERQSNPVGLRPRLCRGNIWSTAKRECE